MAMASTGSALEGGEPEFHKPCYTCQVRFPSTEVLTAHFGTQWHQYNVKRASAELLPVTLETFEKRKAAALARKQAEAEAARPRKFKCTLTGKVFGSMGALRSHYTSKKTRTAIKAKVKAGKLAENPLAGVDVSAWTQDQLPHFVTTIFLDEEPAGGQAAEEEAVPDTKFTRMAQESTIHDLCFLDLQPVESLTKNLERLVTVHGLVIPDIAYLKDLPGLLAHCHDKVLKGQTCIYCNTGFSSVAATVQHMADKGHARLPFDIDGGKAMAEYEGFWDYDKDVEHFNSKGERVVPMTHADREYDAFGNLLLRDGGSLGHREYQKYYVQDLHEKRESSALAAVRAEGTTRLIKHHFGKEVAGALVVAGGASKALSTHVEATAFRAKTEAEKAAERGRTLARRQQAHDETAVKTNKVRNKNVYFVQQYMGAG